MTILQSPALPINMLLIFDMHHLNRALFLNVTSLHAFSFSLPAAAKRSIAPFKTRYASL